MSRSHRPQSSFHMQRFTEWQQYRRINHTPEPQEMPVIEDEMTSKDRSGISIRESWRRGVLLSSLAVLAILIFNVTLTIWSSIKYGTHDGIGVAYTGSCQMVDRWSLGLKILINVLGTVLLGVSSYTMQCLTSPTRADLDRSHADGRWMDIGVSGLRNLRQFPLPRQAMWVALALSSIPIHLLYNSTIFKSLDAQIYGVVVANTAFLNSTKFNHAYSLGLPNPPSSGAAVMNRHDVSTIENIQTAYRTSPGDFDHLSDSDCIHLYGQPTVSGSSDVILVTNSARKTATSEVFYFETVNSFKRDELPYSWICRDLGNPSARANPTLCDALRAERNASHWTVNEEKIEYCLSRKASQHCKLQFSTYMMAAVIVCNAVKLICMLFALFQHRNDIVVTLGDAVSSYLQRPDDLTAEKCMISVNDVKDAMKPGKGYAMPQIIVRTAVLTQTHWGHAASRTRWIVSTATFLVALIIDAAFLIVSAVGVARKQGSSAILWTIGFGSVDSRALVHGPLPQGGVPGLVSAVLLANMPQLLLSLTYVAYNALFTSMLLAREWQGFSKKRQALRVSEPVGEQRATRWLSLPYRYSIPLLACSSMTHFVVSNVLFLVRITIYRHDKIVNQISQLGWSPIPMLSLIVLGIVMMATTFGIARKKSQTVMPMVGSCSFAIAAACHPLARETDAFCSAIQWGAIPDDETKGEEKDNAIGHCTFSRNDVWTPQPGRRYAKRFDTRAEAERDTYNP